MARKKNPNPRKTFKCVRQVINITLDHSYSKQKVLKNLRPLDKIRANKCHCETINQTVFQPRDSNQPSVAADKRCTLTCSTQKCVLPKE